MISFRIDWFDVLEVQGTFKRLLQHHSSKASILQCSTFFVVQLSHLYMSTGKTIALTRWTFFGKVILFFYGLPISISLLGFSGVSNCSFIWDIFLSDPILFDFLWLQFIFCRLQDCNCSSSCFFSLLSGEWGCRRGLCSTLEGTGSRLLLGEAGSCPSGWQCWAQEDF